VRDQLLAVFPDDVGEDELMACIDSVTLTRADLRALALL
jgi:hypothetical protein